MKSLLALALVLVSLMPLAAQEAPLVGTWIGDAPGSRGKDGMKVELTIAKDGETWSLKGTLYKNGQELTTFQGKDFKAMGKNSLQFTEVIEKTPADWKANPTKVVLKGSPEALQYDREFGKKRSFSFLHPKTPEGFAKVILGKVEPPAKKDPPATKNTDTGAPIPSDNPNKLLFAVGPINSILFTEDGKTMVSAAGDSVIRIWDFEGRKQKAAIVADKGLGCIAITPDASFFAGGVGKTPVVWDASGKEIARLGEHIYGVSKVAISPDGKTLISTDDGSTIAGQPDGTTKIWDVASGKEIANIPFCGKLTLAFVPSADRFIFLNGRYVKNPANPLKSFFNFYKAYDSKGKFLYETGSNHQIVRHTAISPDQKTLLSADLLGNVNLLTVATGKIKGSLKNKPFDYINTVAWMPDGKQFAVGGSGGQVVFYDAATGKELKVMKACQGEMHRMAISPDGRFLVAAGYGENAVVVTALKE